MMRQSKCHVIVYSERIEESRILKDEPDSEPHLVQLRLAHRHDVLIQDGTRLASIIGEEELNVNSSHHQAIRHVGDGLRVTAHAPDGIIEGLEDPSHPFYIGVQWHPEDMPAETSASALFGAFVDAARRYAEKKRSASTDLSPVGAAKTE